MTQCGNSFLLGILSIGGAGGGGAGLLGRLHVGVPCEGLDTIIGLSSVRSSGLGTGASFRLLKVLKDIRTLRCME